MKYLSLAGIHGTFDWQDVFAGLLSGLLTFFIKELIERNIKPETG